MIETVKLCGGPVRTKISHPQIIVLPPNVLVSGGGGLNGKNMIVVNTTTSGNGNSSSAVVRNIISLAKSSGGGGGGGLQKVLPRPAVTTATKEPVLRSISLKRPLASASSFSSSESTFSLSDDDNDYDQFRMSEEEERKVRKRANLDHLTAEEKMMRRKLKNRVAAQNARDKKRVKMEEMEQTIKELEEQNWQLLKRNEKLEKENKSLAAENGKLHCLQTISTHNNNVSTSGRDVKVEPETEEDLFPFTPESLATATTTTPPRYDVDDDGDSDSGFVFGCGRSETSVRSPVDFRFEGPAEVVVKVLQQQEPNRDTAAERTRAPETPKSEPETPKSGPETLALLLWLLLLGPLHFSSELSALVAAFSTPELSSLTLKAPTPSSTSTTPLPFKKRTNRSSSLLGGGCHHHPT